MMKRLLAMLLAVCMVAGALPVSAFAAECEHHVHGEESICEYTGEDGACAYMCEVCPEKTNDEELPTGGGQETPSEPVCTGDESCTLTEGHNDGCPKGVSAIAGDEETVTYVAKIGETQYETLQGAIDAATSGQTVQVLVDTELTATLTIAADKNITLDLNGKAITVTKSDGTSLYAFSNNGTLTLVDSIGGGSITARAVDNYGTMIMNSGTIVACDAGGGAVYNEENAVFTMNGGTLKADYVGSYSDNSGPACLRNFGTATLYGGTLDSVSMRTYAIISKGVLTVTPASGKSVAVSGYRGVAIDAGTAVFDGGSFTVKERPSDIYAPETYYALYVGGNDSNVTVNGGTFTAPDDAVWRPDWGEAATDLIINGGTFNGSLIGNDGYYPSQYIVVYGGNYSEKVPEKYLADGYAVSASNDAWKVIKLTGNETIVGNVAVSDSTTLGTVITDAVTNAGENETVTVALPAVATTTSDVTTAVNAIASATDSESGNQGAKVELVIPVAPTTEEKGTVVLNAAAVQNAAPSAEGEEVKLTVEKQSTSTTEEAVYEITLKKGNTEISSLVGEATVTLPMPTGVSHPAVYYMSGTEKVYLDADKVTFTSKTVTFTTDHFSTWGIEANSYDTTWYNDTDTEFTITTAEQLAGLAKLVNEGNNFNGKTIKLGANIDLANKTWTPIGTSTNKFHGHFDGCGYTISNLYINNTSAVGIGLFGYAGKGADAGQNTSIKNLTINNVDLLGDGTIGSIAGNAFVVEFENCHVTGSINVRSDDDSKNYVGGITGWAYATIVNCSVIDTTDDGGKMFGCYVGGIIGLSGEGSTTIKGCTVKNISFTGEAGGISGQFQYGVLIDGNTVDSCSVAQSAGGAQYSGLIAGHNLANSTANFAINNTVTNTTGVTHLVPSNANSVVGTGVVLDSSKKVVSAESLTSCPESALAVGSQLKENADGTWTVEKAVASITKDETTTYYYTFLAAIEAATEGDTVVLMADATDDFTLSNSITLTLGEFSYSGTVTIPDSDKTLTSDNADIKVTAAEKTGYTAEVKKTGATTYSAQWTFKDPTVTVSADKTSLVSTETAKLTAVGTHELSTATITYQWFKLGATDADAVEVATTATYETDKAGTYLCTVTAKDGEIAKSVASETVTITVSAAQGTVTITQETLSAEVGDEPLTFTYTKTEGMTVTVESSNEQVATVKDKDGTVTVTIVGAGTADITVYHKADEKFTEASDKVTLTVVMPTREYKVEHYKQTEEGYDLAETETLSDVAGKKVTATAKEYVGYELNETKSTVSGTLEVKGDTLVLKLYYDVLEKPEYKITKGDGQTVAQDATAEFTSNADFSLFVEVKVDGKVVAPENYTAVSGSTKVTLKDSFIKTLTPGEHTITIVSLNGEATAKFTVKAAETQPTEPEVETNHKFTILKNDEKYHWYVCENEGCAVTSEKKEHEFGSWKVVTKPTETKNGSDERTCKVCSYKETRVTKWSTNSDTSDSIIPLVGVMALSALALAAALILGRKRPKYNR